MDDARQLALSLAAAGDAAIARALLVDVRRVPALEEEGPSSVSLATLAPPTVPPKNHPQLTPPMSTQPAKAPKVTREAEAKAGVYH